MTRQIKKGIRAPRCLVPNNERAQISIGPRRFPGILRVLSLTGGRMRLPEPVAPGTFADIRMSTVSGPFTAAIEFLEVDRANAQGFRFVHVEPTDQRRLEDTLETMRAQGFGGTSRWGLISRLLRLAGRVGAGSYK